MPQLVFVHGVATRSTDEYKRAVVNREKLFRELLFTGLDVEIRSPMWGDTVPVIDAGVFATDKGPGTFNLNVGTLPGLGAGLAGSGANNGLSIIDVGKQDGVAALDAICSEIADQAARAGRDLREDELQAFRNAARHIAANTEATLFTGNASQQRVAEQLTHGGPAAYGIGSLVGDAVSAVTDRVRNAASTLGFGAVRASLSPAVGRFMGDVFVYLKVGPHRDQIRTVVREALLQAHAAKEAGKGPIVLVGHSMGGVILVDMLTDPPAADLPADFAVDALLTVGSQPGLFASLDVLTPNVPPGSARRKPECVKLWLNVFDPIDPLAFRVDTVYKDAIDLVFNSVAGITDTHSKYFQRPQFYARARVRLQEAGIL
jgi:pimeloyl-ACP methyl ester carboxylesterase